MEFGKKKTAPTLLSLTILNAIDNARYLGDVGETDIEFLRQILPHCTLDQLMHIEKSTAGRDLSPATNHLWKSFFEKQFGSRITADVIERMRTKNVSFKWRLLYEAKVKERTEAEDRSIDRIKELYGKEGARKQSRQVQPCSKVPPAKRSFWGGNGPAHNVSHLKGNLMKKARLECLKSTEVKNIVAMKRNAVQKTTNISQVRRGGIYRSDPGGSSSKIFKPNEKRF